MPNHVRNILTFDCDENKLKEILERIQDDEVGVLTRIIILLG